MVTRLRLPPFIATYGMLWMLYGVNYWYMKGDTFMVFLRSFEHWAAEISLESRFRFTSWRQPCLRGHFHALHYVRPRDIRDWRQR